MIEIRVKSVDLTRRYEIQKQIFFKDSTSCFQHILNLWYQAKNEELSHNEVLPYEYVHVIGFCAMSLQDKKPISEVTDEDVKLGRLFIFGLKLRRIGEAEHNAMLKSLITQVASERYIKPDVLW